MTTMRISIDVLNKIVAQDNMTAYRNGFQIRNRFVVIKPLTNILYEHDPLLKSSMVVQNARHNPGSGAYLSINISCKKCKDMAYKIQLLVRITFTIHSWFHLVYYIIKYSENLTKQIKK